MSPSASAAAPSPESDTSRSSCPRPLGFSGSETNGPVTFAVRLPPWSPSAERSKVRSMTPLSIVSSLLKVASRTSAGSSSLSSSPPQPATGDQHSHCERGQKCLRSVQDVNVLFSLSAGGGGTIVGTVARNRGRTRRNERSPDDPLHREGRRRKDVRGGSERAPGSRRRPPDRGALDRPGALPFRLARARARRRPNAGRARISGGRRSRPSARWRRTGLRSRAGSGRCSWSAESWISLPRS